MTKTLIITDYSIKNQAFNGHKPKSSDPIIKSIINKIRSGNMERLMIGGKELYKLYVLGTKYRAIIRVEQNVIYVLILVRHKNAGNATKNISKYDNESADIIDKCFTKVMNDFIKEKYIKIEFE